MKVSVFLWKSSAHEYEWFLRSGADCVCVTGEGHFDDGSNKPSGAATPIDLPEPVAEGKRKGTSKKAKTAKQRLAIADGSGA